jgi:hypothetical protein
MKKRTYRKIAVKEVDVAALAAELRVGRAVFAIDVAKVDMVAAIVAGDGRVVRTVCWKNPSENGLVLELLSGLRRAGLSVEAVMESSGTYGDVLRHQLLAHGVPVYRMSGKRTHDAAEVYDGVPSLHDAKSAAIIAKLHIDGVSTPWGGAVGGEARAEGRHRDDGPVPRAAPAADTQPGEQLGALLAGIEQRQAEGPAEHHQARSRPSAPVPMAGRVSLAAERRCGPSLVRGEDQTRWRATGPSGDSADAQVCAGVVSCSARRTARLEQAV